MLNITILLHKKVLSVKKDCWNKVSLTSKVYFQMKNLAF